jgi:hypothetical protein
MGSLNSADHASDFWSSWLMSGGGKERGFRRRAEST